MCALQFAAQVEQKAIDKDTNQTALEEKLRALDDLLKAQLSS
jgi:cell division protein ZapA